MIIFGSGQIGHDALAFLGAESVDAFCDNDRSLAGTEKYGKPVISFEDLKTKYQDMVIMIAVAGHAAYDVAIQCEENGVSDYLLYSFLRENFADYNGRQMCQFISDPLKREGIRKDIYYKRSEELKSQIDYFARHADIRYMKPAKGELRYRQLQCVQASVEFFRKIEELSIKPMLYGGNLLGYVRHNGFVPWDDDIDFALIRNEYEKLKMYCKSYIYSVDEWEKRKVEKGTETALGMENYYWTLWHDHFNIVEVRDDGYRVGMDFFPLEYYADHYSLKELRELYGRLRTDLVQMNTEEEKIQYIEKARVENRENTASESNNIYFGIDSTEMRHSFHREHFIPRNVVFPLREVAWEGEMFWVPNDAEEFLTYEYERPWDFPKDVGIPIHYKLYEEKN